MNVLILSASDMGAEAARAAYRLHQAFQTFGVSSYMFVQNKR
jgi:hypothetical protein